MVPRGVFPAPRRSDRVAHVLPCKGSEREFDSRLRLVNESTLQRFWDKTRQTDTGCIEWRAARTPKGYGRFKVNGVLVSPHRFIMEWINETTYPRDIDVRHRCDNPPCVNPAHLQPGTRSANMLDARDRGRLVTPNPYKDATHCRRGHEFTRENTGIRPNGYRYCKKCKNDKQNERRNQN